MHQVLHNFTYIIIRMFINLEDENRRANAFAAEAMFIIASIIHFGKSGLPKMAITEDDLDRFVF